MLHHLANELRVVVEQLRHGEDTGRYDSEDDDRTVLDCCSACSFILARALFEISAKHSTPFEPPGTIRPGPKGAPEAASRARRCHYHHCQ